MQWSMVKLKSLPKLIGFLAVLFTVILHGISIFPLAWSVLFPNPDLQIVEYNSSSRLVIANTGNHELFISYVHYEGCKNLQEGAKCINSNEDVGVSIKPGEVIKRNFDINFPKNFYAVAGQGMEEWNQTLNTAICHRRSTCIQPLFFDPADRRYKQLQQTAKLSGTVLNTFPLEVNIHAYSPRLREEIIFPFDITGVVIKSNEIECKEILDEWLALPECEVLD